MGKLAKVKHHAKKSLDFARRGYSRATDKDTKLGKTGLTLIEFGVHAVTAVAQKRQPTGVLPGKIDIPVDIAAMGASAVALFLARKGKHRATAFAALKGATHAALGRAVGGDIHISMKPASGPDGIPEVQVHRT